MHKKIYFFLAFFFFAVTGACAQEVPRVLVVYYSRDGHTQKVAERLAEKFDATLERLVDKKKRTGPFGTFGAGKDAMARNATKIAPLSATPDDFDIILIGTPSWFSNMTPAVRTFIAQHDLAGKRLAVFATAHLTGVEVTVEKVAQLIAPDDPKSIPQLPLLHRDLDEAVLEGKIEEFYQAVLSAHDSAPAR